MTREVVVTGVGMITPFGIDARDSHRSWMEGQTARTTLCPELKGSALETMPVAALPDFEIAERIGDRRMMKYMSFAAMLGCAAAREASAAAGLDRFAPERVGLFVGTGLVAAGVDEVRPMLRASVDDAGRFSCRLFGSKGLAATNPLLSFHILANMPACFVSIIEKIKGPNLIFTPWEGQTGAALIEAWRAVRSGACDAALTGAADHPTHPSTVLHLHRAGLLGPGERPASGAAYLVMETADSAAAHRRRPLAVIDEMTLEPTDDGVDDPLAARMGRSYAAAPAILTALHCLNGPGEFSLAGVDGVRFRARLGAAA